MRPLTAVLFLLIGVTPIQSQSARDSGRPFEITDNSFLVEEAFNQEAGIFQNILLIQRPRARAWSFEFTQEWPLGGERHQLSYTVPIVAMKESGADSYDVDRGTIALNYRLQLLSEAAGQPAVSPRLSLLIPDFPESDAQFGIQVNLPASKQLNDFFVHANAGYTVEGIASEPGAPGRAPPAGSLIYRALPMVHLMAESVFRAEEYGSEHSMLVSPGFRAGWNFGDRQLVLGAAVPIGVFEQDESAALLVYFSYELPFKKQP
jgi:hypothetical protein